MRVILRKLFIAMSLLTSWYDTIGQFDTVKPATYFSNKLITQSQDTTFHYKIKNITFPFLLGQQNEFPFDLLFSKELRNAYDENKNTFIFRQPLLVDNCTQYRAKGQSMIEAKKRNINYLFNDVVDLNNIKSLPNLAFRISNLSDPQKVVLEFSHIFGLLIQNCQSNFFIAGDSIERNINVIGNESTTMGSLYIENNHFLGADAEISVLGPVTFNGEITIDRNSYKKKYEISFYDDTLNKSLSVDWQAGDENTVCSDSNSLFHLNFSGCYINAPILVSKNAKRCRITFTGCKFGPNANLNVPGDILELVACDRLPATCNLFLSKFKDTCWIRISNTDLSDLPFEYEPRFHLLFYKDEPADNYMPVYENLLAKFKKESKNDSYQRLDIEYQDYKASRGTALNKLWNWVQGTWWNYGYARARVFLWTMLFWGIFVIGNFFLWNCMQRLYPLSEDNSVANRMRRRGFLNNESFGRRIVYGMIYTSYIFFSIKLDFSKLRLFASSVWVILFFFLQYLGGLVCLFFILNYLLKA